MPSTNMDSGEPNSHCLALYQPQQPSPGVLSPNQNILNIEKPTKPKQKPQQKNLLVWPSLAAKYDNPKKQSSSSTSSNVPGDSNSSSTTTSTFRKRKAGDEGSSVSGDSKKTKVQSGQEDEKAKKSKQETESTSTTPLRQQGIQEFFSILSFSSNIKNKGPCPSVDEPEPDEKDVPDVIFAPDESNVVNDDGLSIDDFSALANHKFLEVEICLDGGFPKVSKKTKCRKWIEIVAHRGEIIRNTTSPEERQVLLNSLYGIDRRKKYKLNNALINRALPRMAKTEEDSANTNRDNNSPQPDGQWLVEKVIGDGKWMHHQHDYLAKYYYLKWKGWGYCDSTWEIYDPEGGMQHLIKDYHYRKAALQCVQRRIQRKREAHWREYKIVNRDAADRTQMQMLVSLHSWEDQLNKIAERANQGRILVENWVDNEMAPGYLKFMTKNKLSQKAILDLRPPEIGDVFCTCQGNDCSKADCCPSRFAMKPAFLNGDDRITKITNFKTGVDWIVECHNECLCTINCSNRTTQRGRKVPIVIFRTVDRGWSVRTLYRLSRNEFVMAYIGEVMTIAEADELNLDSSYQFLINCVGAKTNFLIDAARCGNEARFVNHSCNPNMRVIPVFVGRKDFRLYELGFFTVKDIEAGEELTIDYSYYEPPGKRSKTKNRTKCLCNYGKCKNYFYS